MESRTRTEQKEPEMNARKRATDEMSEEGKEEMYEWARGYDRDSRAA